MRTASPKRTRLIAAAVLAVAATGVTACGGGARSAASSAATSTPSGATSSSSTTTAHPLTRSESVATVCGDLRARLGGIENEAGARDPQPGSFRGRREIRRLRRGSRHSVAALEVGVVALKRLRVGPAALAPIRASIHDYGRFLRRLKIEGPPVSSAAGLSLRMAYVRIGVRAKGACR